MCRRISMVSIRFLRETDLTEPQTEAFGSVGPRRHQRPDGINGSHGNRTKDTTYGPTGDGSLKCSIFALFLALCLILWSVSFSKLNMVRQPCRSWANFLFLFFCFCLLGKTSRRPRDRIRVGPGPPKRNRTWSSCKLVLTAPVTAAHRVESLRSEFAYGSCLAQIGNRSGQ